MKYFLILGAIMAGVSARTQIIIKLPQEKILQAQKYTFPCAEKYNVDPSLLLKTTDGSIERDEASNNFLYCFTTSGGFVSEDGHMVVDRIAALVADHPLVEEFKEALRKCNEVTKENPIATVVEMNICMMETAPLRFVF